jgi:hypothetical protein
MAESFQTILISTVMKTKFILEFTLLLNCYFLHLISLGEFQDTILVC